jgi:hypothetical protein
MELHPFEYEIWSTDQGSYILAPVVGRQEDEGTCLVSTIELREFGDMREAREALKQQQVEKVGAVP